MSAEEREKGGYGHGRQSGRLKDKHRREREREK